MFWPKRRVLSIVAAGFQKYRPTVWCRGWFGGVRVRAFTVNGATVYEGGKLLQEQSMENWLIEEIDRREVAGLV